MDFVVEQVVALGGQNEVVVYARKIGAGDFHLGEVARLGGVLIRPLVNQPRVLLQDGAPRQDLFAFTLVERSDAGRLSIGQTVALDSGKGG